MTRMVMRRPDETICILSVPLRCRRAAGTFPCLFVMCFILHRCHIHNCALRTYTFGAAQFLESISVRKHPICVVWLIQRLRGYTRFCSVASAFHSVSVSMVFGVWLTCDLPGNSA